MGSWNAYSNQYWPAEYLIDKDGVIRHTHFGEGEYDQTERAIQALLREAGHNVNMPVTAPSGATPLGNETDRQTGELYAAAGRGFNVNVEHPSQAFDYTDPGPGSGGQRRGGALSRQGPPAPRGPCRDAPPAPPP